MKLQDTLNEMKEKFEATLPPEIKAEMHAATDALVHSGITEKAIQPGAHMPVFSLLDENENEVSSQTLLGKGPLVVTFYRGVW